MEFLGFGCMMVIGFFVFFVCWAAAIGIIRPRYYWLWMCASLPVYVPVFCGVAYVWLTARLEYESHPPVIFHESFGFWPAPDVKIVNSYKRDSLKFDDSSLEFYAEQPTIDQILLANGLHPILAKEIAHSYSSQPLWWPRNPGPEFKIYGTILDNSDFHDYLMPQQVLMYNAQTKHAYERCRR